MIIQYGTQNRITDLNLRRRLQIGIMSRYDKRQTVGLDPLLGRAHHHTLLSKGMRHRVGYNNRTVYVLESPGSRSGCASSRSLEVDSNPRPGRGRGVNLGSSRWPSLVSFY